uniref:Uncharacterized protein n=1 Tax=Strigamia maritima TaxID=126957 RepID=T1II45_STRMM
MISMMSYLALLVGICGIVVISGHQQQQYGQPQQQQHVHQQQLNQQQQQLNQQQQGNMFDKSSSSRQR